MNDKEDCFVSAGILTPHLHCTFLWGLGESSFHVGVCCVASFFLCHLCEFPSLSLGKLYTCLLSIFPMKNKSMTSQMCLLIVCRTESVHSGSSINTRRGCTFFISVYWYMPINPLPPCVNHTLINSPRCQSLVGK